MNKQNHDQIEKILTQLPKKRPSFGKKNVTFLKIYWHYLKNKLYFKQTMRMLVYATALVLIVGVSFGGFKYYTYHSDSVTKDNPLYDIKTDLEAEKLAVTENPEEKAKFYIDQTSRRVAEAINLAKHNQTLGFIPKAYANNSRIDSDLLNTLKEVFVFNDQALEQIEQISSTSSAQNVLEYFSSENYQNVEDINEFLGETSDSVVKALFLDTMEGLLDDSEIAYSAYKQVKLALSEEQETVQLAFLDNPMIYTLKKTTKSEVQLIAKEEPVVEDENTDTEEEESNLSASESKETDQEEQEVPPPDSTDTEDDEQDVPPPVQSTGPDDTKGFEGQSIDVDDDTESDESEETEQEEESSSEEDIETDDSEEDQTDITDEDQEEQSENEEDLPEDTTSDEKQTAEEPPLQTEKVFRTIPIENLETVPPLDGDDLEKNLETSDDEYETAQDNLDEALKSVEKANSALQNANEQGKDTAEATDLLEAAIDLYSLAEEEFTKSNLTKCNELAEEARLKANQARLKASQLLSSANILDPSYTFSMEETVIPKRKPIKK